MDVDTPMAILESYKAAVYDQSVNAFLQLYTQDARVYDTWGVWSYEGTASRRQAIEGWFASLGEERVRVSFDEVNVVVAQELAVLSATGRYAAHSTDGLEIRSMQNRLTWALQRKDDRWLIVHEHTSTPIGFSDLKGILRRDDA
ncbi:YybH family protein [Povalibacter sp.]|uniref:YybH family protein n=1 Tax=Povalibacter sp. TaxID=1962978 RepID=UPI002F42224C